MSAHAESEMSNKNPKNKHAVLRDLVAKQTLWPSAFEMSNDIKKTLNLLFCPWFCSLF